MVTVSFNGSRMVAERLSGFEERSLSRVDSFRSRELVPTEFTPSTVGSRP